MMRWNPRRFAVSGEAVLSLFPYPSTKCTRLFGRWLIGRVERDAVEPTPLCRCGVGGRWLIGPFAS